MPDTVFMSSHAKNQEGILFREKYRIPSTRVPEWDYRCGTYFVTICTKDFVRCFGEVKDQKMYLSEMGEVVQEELLKTPIIRSYIDLGAFIVMPNHMHIVIQINPVETPRRGVSTLHCTWSPGCLGAIINQFKSICTKRIRITDPTFAWQSRFHEHIIRNDEEKARIEKYILENPNTWERDTYFIS